MFRYKLRTLLIVLALAPPVLAAGWLAARSMFARLVQSGIVISVDVLLLLATLVASVLVYVFIERRIRRAS